MKINRSTGYALAALSHIVAKPKGEITLSQEISKKHDIPLEYLLKIMQLMVRANILKSKRGPRGGFYLSRSLSTITLLEVIEAIEGPIEPSLGLEDVKSPGKMADNASKAYSGIIKDNCTALRKVKLSSLVK